MFIVILITNLYYRWHHRWLQNKKAIFSLYLKNVVLKKKNAGGETMPIMRPPIGGGGGMIELSFPYPSMTHCNLGIQDTRLTEKCAIFTPKSQTQRTCTSQTLHKNTYKSQTCFCQIHLNTKILFQSVGANPQVHFINCKV